jgi:hypothetical protein
MQAALFADGGKAKYFFWSAISGYFLQVWPYETLSTSSRKSANHFFSSYSVSFSARDFHIFTFSGDYLSPVLQSFFIIIKYLSIITIETQFVCSKMVCQFVYDWQENITFGILIKPFSKCSRIIIAIGS